MISKAITALAVAGAMAIGTWAAISAAAASNAEYAQQIKQKKADQNFADHRDLAASKYCKHTDGEDAAWWWEKDANGVDQLVCVPTY